MQGSFRITETILNDGPTAQNASFNFYIAPGFIDNVIATPLTGSNFVSAGLNFDIRRNGSTVWGSSASLSSDVTGTSYAASGDTALYVGTDAYRAVPGGYRSVDLGLIQAGESITLSYEMSSFARGSSSAGAGRWVAETNNYVPGQWIDLCSGECGTPNMYFSAGHTVTVPAHFVEGGVSRSHASSGDPFEIDLGYNGGNPYFTGVRALPDDFAASVTFTTAVPEPKTNALLLAGLALMGAFVRRRQAHIGR
ncbi:PEP-CTERM sorting domain-containing protein [Roseateles oligotrophus]|uniref:PEP-CTERM sorting domain-containing protein n=1 Tax=Roseateles oligotrophus TaxID=1769250 RepID=A0ABT2YKZ7_9BURK|nr:PEP-CTERM sorting domain-containing protein [Roseateles oligotrophus]MCV2370727.1 PEP-CTERM sorting domain-containing protein [Roseateles oligotrophus]